MSCNPLLTFELLNRCIHKIRLMNEIQIEFLRKFNL